MPPSEPTPYVQHRRRLRKVVDHIGTAVEARHPDEELTLRRLAAIACWSPEHLDRVYRQVRGEPPLATVRRLRLRRASLALCAGEPLADVAERAGYGSSQAFGRAFRRQFGLPPLAWLAKRPAAAGQEPLSIVQLAQDVPCHAIDFRGAAHDVSSLFDEMLLRLARSGSPRSQWQVFGATRAPGRLGDWHRAGGVLELSAVALAPVLAAAPKGTSAWRLRAGRYARIPAQQAGALPWDDLLREGGWERTGGTVLRHYDTDPAYTAQQERREWWYLPVVARAA